MLFLQNSSSGAELFLWREWGRGALELKKKKRRVKVESVGATKLPLKEYLQQGNLYLKTWLKNRPLG